MSELPGLLALTFRAVIDQLHERLAEDGFADIRPAHGFAFQYLSHRPNGVTAVELAEHLGVTKQAGVQLVDELTKRGYVERRAHPTDRRSRLITLTQRGWQCIGRMEFRSQEIENHLAKLIGSDQLEHLHNGLLAVVRDAATRRPVTLRPVW